MVGNGSFFLRCERRFARITTRPRAQKPLWSGRKKRPFFLIVFIPILRERQRERNRKKEEMKREKGDGERLLICFCVWLRNHIFVIIPETRLLLRSRMREDHRNRMKYELTHEATYHERRKTLGKRKTAAWGKGGGNRENFQHEVALGHNAS